MIEELAKDYSEYVNVDLSNELQHVEETVDDMLTRLDEFEHLVNMVKSDASACVDTSVPQIMFCREKLNLLCNRIDSLEHFVNRVKSDMDILESRVEEAETDIGSQNMGKLKNIFKPLFFKKSPADLVAKRPSRTPTYEAPKFFSTSSYFPHKEDIS